MGISCLRVMMTRSSQGEVSFYEVIRIREGIPLFFDDHMKRMSDGISTRYELDHDISGKVREGLDALVRIESFPEINARVTVTFTGRDYSLHLCYIPSSYPDDEMIREGVSLILYHAERFNPGVKVLNNRLRLSVNEELVRRKAYEALLVNSEGYITEGSRSNVFFVTDTGVIHTAPDKCSSVRDNTWICNGDHQEGSGLILSLKLSGRLRSAVSGQCSSLAPRRWFFRYKKLIIRCMKQIIRLWRESACYTPVMAAESIRSYKLKKSKD